MFPSVNENKETKAESIEQKEQELPDTNENNIQITINKVF